MTRTSIVLIFNLHRTRTALGVFLSTQAGNLYSIFHYVPLVNRDVKGHSGKAFRLINLKFARTKLVLFLYTGSRFEIGMKILFSALPIDLSGTTRIRSFDSARDRGKREARRTPRVLRLRR